MRVWLYCLLGVLAWPAAGADRTWVEVTGPHFTVISNAGEKQARRVAEQFEQIRAVLGSGLKLRVDPGKPFIILALKDSDSFKALLPQFWETKNHAHPAGVFHSGIEKHYVTLRLDVNGTGDQDNPYHVVYHEYVHMLIGLSYRSLPLWLNEGLAEFYGNTL